MEDDTGILISICIFAILSITSLVIFIIYNSSHNGSATPSPSPEPSPGPGPSPGPSPSPTPGPTKEKCKFAHGPTNSKCKNGRFCPPSEICPPDIIYQEPWNCGDCTWGVSNWECPAYCKSELSSNCTGSLAGTKIYKCGLSASRAPNARAVSQVWKNRQRTYMAG